MTRYHDDEFDRLVGLAAKAGLFYDEGETYRFDHPELRQVLYARVPARQRGGGTWRSPSVSKQSSDATAGKLPSRSPITSTWPGQRQPRPNSPPRLEARPSSRSP